MTPMKPQAFLLLFALALSACAPGRFGPIHFNPQDDILFREGLRQWQDGRSDPEAFRRLAEEYPESSLTLAVAALRTEAEQTAAARKQAAQDRERLQRLERQRTQGNRELDVCRAQVRSLEAQVEQFKQILIETESR